MSDFGAPPVIPSELQQYKSVGFPKITLAFIADVFNVAHMQWIPNGSVNFPSYGLLASVSPSLSPSHISHELSRRGACSAGSSLG